MPYASHLLNHSRKLRNASKLLHHERAVLVRCFSSDVQSSVNTNRDMWKTRFHGYESSSKNGVSKQSPNFTKRNITMATMERGSISGSLFNRGISRSSQLQSRRCYASASDLPPHQEIGMPSLSPTMTEGNIARWLKKEGDKVSTGEVLCEVETDKATVELECMEEGYLAKIVHGDGSKEIKVGEVIAVTVEDEEDIAKFKDYHPSASESGDSTAKETSSPPPPKKEVDEEPSREPEPKVSKPSEPSSSGDRIFASPLARKLAEEKNVPLSSIKGTGSEGLIVKGDVEDYLASGVKEVSSPSKAKAATDASLDYTDIPVSQIRKITASRLLLSKQTIPHYYLTVDTCVDKLISLRTHLNSLQEGSGGARISVNDLVIKGLSKNKTSNCEILMNMQGGKSAATNTKEVKSLFVSLNVVAKPEENLHFFYVLLVMKFSSSQMF
ncbi:PREDICTED: dihydrolipoyllysine-residue acetyltransferase component 2 of pyruvate dehydrogenase complex, mitochondrial-like isoform X4 [Lupinus angustifolius]|uniref:dihydrolipoyllysine-residue acetyltransferase component 2 of pyruvate dehydrogenase complex, mitochondrial-like isoform X4 n=1 Tax=Lupinus angustifolius TaxID=3871 RepID=UPI00092FAF39|nr:PREDICTED: dihydrolipoyllysine-residue acetyltransferase component 2 of pyruvate dehydrogenase complex, mitochondrial-like isoform X4 [Lupinus angustifolius]